jgi:hypothetical protein
MTFGDCMGPGGRGPGGVGTVAETKRLNVSLQPLAISVDLAALALFYDKIGTMVKASLTEGATRNNRLPLAGLISFWARSGSSDENFGKDFTSVLHKVIRSKCAHNTP